MTISSGFQVFPEVAPEIASAWSGVVRALDQHSALDPLTEELAYLSVLAALGMHGGIGFHAAQACQHGATREQVVSAVLLGLPAAGHRVLDALPVALAAFDAV